MTTLLSRLGPLSSGSFSKFPFSGLFSDGGHGDAGLIETFFQRWTQRMTLSEMDDDRLADIGVSRADARKEAQKPFWRA